MPITTNGQQGAIWRFPVRYWRVYDGDTIMDMYVDVGFGIHFVINGRLLDINAPEVRGVEREAGLKAQRYLEGALTAATLVEIVTTRPANVRQPIAKKGKYGRWLIEVYADGVNLNEKLVSRGLAERKIY
jgi:endonuclease YncB( thermonuclease family)